MSRNRRGILICPQQGVPFRSLWRKPGCGRNADETRTAKSKGPNALLRASEKRGPVRLGAASVPISILSRKGTGLQASKHRRFLNFFFVRITARPRINPTIRSRLAFGRFESAYFLGETAQRLFSGLWLPPGIGSNFVYAWGELLENGFDGCAGLVLRRMLSQF